MVLLISYDLNRHERPEAYAKVRKMIEEHARSTIKPLYSQWFVDTADSVEDWHDRMARVADSDDNWLVIKVQKPYQGWLPKAAWTWLDTRI